VIAHFAEVTKPKLRQLADETTGLLADLVARRRQIVEMIAAEGQRARRMSDKRLTKSVARLRKALEKELSELDALIGNQIRGSTLWAEKENHPPSRHYLVGARREAAGKRAPTQPVILGPPRLSLERQILLLVIGRPFVELPLQPCTRRPYRNWATAPWTISSISCGSGGWRRPMRHCSRTVPESISIKCSAPARLFGIDSRPRSILTCWRRPPKPGNCRDSDTAEAPKTKAESKAMLFQNPFQDGPDGNAIRVLYTIGGAITGLVIGGLLIQTINIDAGTADIIEVIMMLLGSCGGFLVGDSQSRAARAIPKLMASNQELERTWAALDYTIILGLMVTLVGAFLQFIIPDWRLLLISAGGMLVVVIALWYGRNLKQP
jgi:hypothetical protein